MKARVDPRRASDSVSVAQRHCD